MSINDISEILKSNPEHTRRICTELFCKKNEIKIIFEEVLIITN